MQNNQRNLGLILVIIIALMAVGVATVVYIQKESEQTTKQIPVEEKEIATANIPTDTASIEEPTAIPAEDDRVLASPTTSEGVQPTARVGLQGTDPDTVNLASGDIQLVEFFAFW